MIATCRWPSSKLTLITGTICTIPGTVYLLYCFTAVLVTVKARLGARAAELLLNADYCELLILLCCCNRDHEGEGG